MIPSSSSYAAISPLSLLDTMKVSYLRQGDRILFHTRRIEEEKEKIKQKILDMSHHNDTFEITIRQFNIPETFLHNILREFQEEHILRGIIHFHENIYYFHSEQAIQDLFLENKYEFSLEALFPNKTFTVGEKELIESIITRLEKEKQLKGTYDKEKMHFISEDLSNAEEYGEIVKAAKRKGRHIISQFKKVLEDMKSILVNTEEQIAPNQITAIEEIMNWIGGEQKKWCAEFDAFLHKKSAEVKKNVSREPEIKTLWNSILSFRALFNKLSVNYNSIIYYQRLYIARKVDINSKKKYFALLRKHRLFESKETEKKTKNK